MTLDDAILDAVPSVPTGCHPTWRLPRWEDAMLAALRRGVKSTDLGLTARAHGMTSATHNCDADHPGAAADEATSQFTTAEEP